jgi:hypothetical protein
MRKKMTIISVKNIMMAMVKSKSSTVIIDQWFFGQLMRCTGPSDPEKNQNHFLLENSQIFEKKNKLSNQNCSILR